MLIESQRHTEADLVHWRRLEIGDRLHGAILDGQGRYERCRQTVRQFLSHGPAYVAVSWGKDSTVIAHLAAGLAPLVNIVQLGPKRDPDVPRVRDAFLARFDADYREVEVEPMEKRQADGRKAPQLETGIARAAEMMGTRRYIGGLRAEESAGRRASLKSRGLSNTLSCSPVGWWRPLDVFGWLAHHGLPVHPAYAMTMGGRWPRDKIRVSIIGGAKGQGFGRRVWERAYYPEIMQAVEDDERAANQHVS